MKRWMVLTIFAALATVALAASVLRALIKFFLLLPIDWLHWQVMEMTRRLVWWTVRDRCNCAECLKERNER